MLLFQTMHGVFHHHHRAVHDHAEIDGTQTHEVRADAVQSHAEKTDEHGKRNDGSGDDRRPDVSEKQQQDHSDENKSLEEILLHCVDGAVDDERLIVERGDLDSLWQMEACDFRFYSFNQCFPVFAFEHNDRARYCLPVSQRGALRRRRADTNFRYIPHEYRGPFFRHQHDISEIVRRGGATASEQRVLFRSVLDVAASEIRVVLLHAQSDVMQRQSVLLQHCGIDDNLKLLSLPAPHVHVANTRDGAQLPFDYPLVEILQLHRAHRTRKRVLVKFSEGRGRQPQRRLDSLREQRRDLLQAFAHELPREVHRHRIVKYDRNHRQSEFRERPYLFFFGQPQHRPLDRIGDELLDFRGRQRRCFGHDHYLIVGKVRKRFHGDGVERVSSGREQHHDPGQNEPAVRQREINDSIQHGSFIPLPSKRVAAAT